MNILQLQDNLKNFSEEQLVNEMRRPSGMAPQYLVLSEMNRRQRVKSDYQAAQASDPSTVAEEAVASAGVPASGIMGMAQAMAPKSESSLSAPKPPAMMMREGGVVNAQQGTYFPSTPELYGIYGQESGFGKNLMGSSGEVGPFQVMPTTALMPGYGMLELFPEISAQIGKGKKYETAEQAYADNKEKIDSVLMSGEKTEPFVKSYLDAAEKKLGSRDLALLAYNQGIGGTEGFKGNPLDTDYVSGVKSNIPMYDERPIKPNLLTQMMTSTGEASTQDDKNEDKSLLEKIFTTKIPGSEYIDPIGPLYRFGKDKMGPAISEFYDDYIKGASQGGKEKNILRAIEGPATKKYLDEQEKIELGAMLESDIDYTEPKSFLDTIKQAASSSDNETQRQKDIREANIKSGEIDKLPDAGIVAEGITPETTKPSVKTGEGDQKKAPTLDEQIIAMQEDLAKSREQDKYLALAQAGLAIMASDKPTLGQAIGEGAGVGLQAYRDAQERYQEGVVDLLNARAKLAKNKNVFSMDDALNRVIGLTNSIAKLEEQIIEAQEFPTEESKKTVEALKQELKQTRALRDQLTKSYTGINPNYFSKAEVQAAIKKQG